MRKNFILWALFALTTSAFAIPKQVMIVRHAEKPPIGDSLTVLGQERAAALAPFFLGTPKYLDAAGTPAAVFASARTITERSKRPYETCEPTANALGLSVNNSFRHKKVEDLAHEIMTNPAYDGKNVLICWQHGQIPRMVYAFGVRPMMPAWPHNVYDRVVLLQFNQQGKITQFENLPQRLMYGDSEH